MTLVHVYKYFELNRNVSRNVENLMNRLISEALTQASSFAVAIVSVTFHLKKLILKLDKMTFNDSLRKIIEFLIKCHCLKSEVLFD